MSERLSLHFNGWQGRWTLAVEVVKVMAKRVRVRLLESGRLAGRGRWGRVGDEITVPKSALSRGIR